MRQPWIALYAQKSTTKATQSGITITVDLSQNDQDTWYWYHPGTLVATTVSSYNLQSKKGIVTPNSKHSGEHAGVVLREAH